MIYRSVGDLLRLVQPTTLGNLKYGLWYEHQTNTRSKYEIDWTLGGAINKGYGKAGPYNATDRLMYDTLDSAQPYLELDWHLTPRLTLTPGLKYVWFRRSIDASVNQHTGLPLTYSKAYSDSVPSMALHYKVAPHWTAYGQVAKGFLAPNLNFFYTADPAASSPKPETTVNYQVGTAYQTQALTLSGDVYYIDFNNKVGSRTVGSNKIFYNQGGVIYKGIEGSATQYIGDGFSGYINGSINSAKTKGSSQWIAGAPKSTAVLGVIYNRRGVYGSLLDKYVGSRFGDSGETQSLTAYSVASLALGYKLDTGMAQSVDLRLKINNLFDKHGIYALAGYTGDATNTPLYWTLPGRSAEVSLSAKF